MNSRCKLGIAIFCLLGLHASATEDQLSAQTVALGSVAVRPDLVYATIAGYRPLRLDLYQPPASTKPRPLVIFIHGGAWTYGHKRQTSVFADWPEILAKLASRGYVVAALEYRLSAEAPYPAAVLDVKSALRFLRADAPRYGINPTQVALWGASAGAHLAALAALMPESPETPRVQALVGWYGPYDVRPLYAASLKAPLEKLSQRDREETLGGIAFLTAAQPSGQEELLRDASAGTHLNAAAPPTLLLHGTADTLVPPSQSQTFSQQMRDLGLSITHQEIDGVGHGWSHADPARAASASEDAMQFTTEWLVKTLPPVNPVLD